VRIYLTGSVCIEGERATIREADFPGRQGRLLFAYLVAAEGEPVARDAILDLLWPESPPTAPEGGIAALVSKLRALLARAGVPHGATIESGLGMYQLRLPADAWVDRSYAARLVEEAEGALRRNELDAAWISVFLSRSILRRPFLPEEHVPWVLRRREDQRADLARALEILCDVWLARGDTGQATLAARDLVELEPFRETSYQRLMRAHASAGNRAEALRVYASCRRLLADELGIDPSPPTEAVYLEILRR
jgi:SARP family transcriptional regulator, regulator of embCAB operon